MIPRPFQKDEDFLLSILILWLPNFYMVKNMYEKENENGNL